MNRDSKRPLGAAPDEAGTPSEVVSPADHEAPCAEAAYGATVTNATIGAIAVGPGARAEGTVNVTVVRAAPSTGIPTHSQVSTITEHSWQFALAETLEDQRYTTIRELYLLLGYAFMSAEASTGISRFGFLVSHVARRSTVNAGALDSAISIRCHMTAFVKEFAQLTQSIEQGRFLERTACYPENDRLEYDAAFGIHMPCLVSRLGPHKVRIQNLCGTPLIFRLPLRATDILFYLSGFARGVPAGIDDLDLHALTERERRFLRYTERTKRRGRFSFDDIHVSVADPEQWSVV